MRKIALPFLMLLLCLHGCAEMPAYSNVTASDASDESRYTVVETDTYAGRPQRHLLDDQADLNIIRVNDKKVGNIPFSTYYYRNDSPQRAILIPGKYKIQLEYRLPRYFMFAELDFEGKPGQKIIARSEYIGLNRIKVWLEDAATGEVVSQRAKY
ncbi:hypothetical protein [Pseudomonas veronii]|uniref:Lipoprotein n=1 Tax=Pseudomonas veronii TaxID=76761 RepID=A0A5M8FQY9_PSEVE|nr:hypothetical protein [Pseudomonas veronii]KAA6172512.1 hypothetical protein F3K54_20760 [Pseudomonas veronii]KAA6185721.1 hypothetical protein F3K53_04505 [Pseudomonas veronii]